MDVSSIVGNLLQDQWTLENNDIPVVKYDEFDPKNPQLQIVIENFPARPIWVVDNKYRIQHTVRITLYEKFIFFLTVFFML